MSVVRIFFMLMIGVCSFQASYAQEDSARPAAEASLETYVDEEEVMTAEDEQELKAAAAQIDIRHAREEDVAALREMKALQYDRPKEEKKRAEWLIALGIWVVLHTTEIKYFYYGLLGAIFVLVVLAFLRKSDLGLFHRRSKKTKEEAEAEIEEGPQNYEALAQSAIAQGDFRSAIRARYLHALQLLEGKSLIIPGKDKTNMEFLRELSSTAFHQPFSKLTRHYEYIWYGKVPLSSGQFAQLDEQFAEFKKSLR